MGVRLYMKWIRFIPAIIWMGVIFYLSHQSGSELKSIFPFLDSFNWGHLVAYFILAWLIYWAMHPVKTIRVKLISIAVCILYGLTDEWHQSFVPMRQPDLYDLFNDTIGATVAMVLAHWREIPRRP
jgi:VanZ family protein